MSIVPWSSLYKTNFVILSEAKDLLSGLGEKQQVLRFAQDDKFDVGC